MESLFFENEKYENICFLIISGITKFGAMSRPHQKSPSKLKLACLGINVRFFFHQVQMNLIHYGQECTAQTYRLSQINL